METLNTLLNHRSIRHYSNRDISEKTLQQILEAAVRGSTTGNMQLYSIIITRDAAMKAQMAPLHFNQPMVTSAPLILTFCADLNRFSKWCQYRDAAPSYNNIQSFFWAAADTFIAAQNACIASESLGLGYCWLGTISYNTDEFIKLLKLPKLTLPLACITFGYPQETPDLTDRLPIEAVCHQETYTNYTQESINEFYAIKENLESTFNLLKENNLQNLAQIFTQKRYPKKDTEFFAEKLMKVLAEQGFIK